MRIPVLIIEEHDLNEDLFDPNQPLLTAGSPPFYHQICQSADRIEIHTKRGVFLYKDRSGVFGFWLSKIEKVEL